MTKVHFPPKNIFNKKLLSAVELSFTYINYATYPYKSGIHGREFFVSKYLDCLVYAVYVCRICIHTSTQNPLFVVLITAILKNVVPCHNINTPLQSHCTRKPTICICENKGADQLRGADQHLCFCYTQIVQYLYFLNMKVQASSFFFSTELYSPVRVRPRLKPKLLVLSRDISIYYNIYYNVIHITVLVKTAPSNMFDMLTFNQVYGCPLFEGPLTVCMYIWHHLPHI